MQRKINCFVALGPDWKPVFSVRDMFQGKVKPEYEKLRTIKVLVDSGAAENVIPPGLLPDFEIKEGEAKRNNVRHTTVDGNELPNLGEICLPFRTKEGHKCGVTFQVCDVSRPLLSVTAFTAKGNVVAFHDHGGTITGKDGKKMSFRKESGVYILEMYVAPFPGPGHA